jgi:MFS family permease
MTRAIPKSHMIYTITVIGFIYALHLVIPMYSNSSFLGLFASERTIGFIYMAGSAISILGYLIAPWFIRRMGNYNTVLSLIILQIGFFYGLISSTNPITLSILFILQVATISLISLCLDIFLEVYTEGSNVGKVRGLYTATLNASWLIAPFIGSLLISGTNNYRNTYVAALAMLFPLLYLIYRNFPRFKDPNYTHLSTWQFLTRLSSNKNWAKLFSANLILQTFYAWMVVYSPIYLNKYVGFSWESIGIILVIMLLPFPLIQYPLGKMTDGKNSSKRIMALGFLIMGISTIALSLLTTPSIIAWSIALTTTRIGAAMAEIMIEVNFFKTISSRDSATLGLFRITRPLSYFIGPLISIIGLMFTTDQYLFVITGVISLIAIYPALLIRDTK